MGEIGRAILSVNSLLRAGGNVRMWSYGEDLTVTAYPSRKPGRIGIRIREATILLTLGMGCLLDALVSTTTITSIQGHYLMTLRDYSRGTVTLRIVTPTYNESVVLPYKRILFLHKWLRGSNTVPVDYIYSILTGGV